MTQSKLRTLLNQLEQEPQHESRVEVARTALALIRSLDKHQLAQLQLLLARAEGELDD